MAAPIAPVHDPARWPALAAMLGRAFGEDPAFSHIFPDARMRAARLPRFFELVLRTDAPEGFVLQSADGTGAALWRAPGKAHVSTLAMLRHGPALLGAFGRTLPRALALGDAIEAHHPEGRYWYLHVLGCDPARQRQGTGSALVRAGLDRIAGDGLPCYLETATPANVGFYERLGFAVTEQWQAPGGPMLWSMLRQPDAAAAHKPLTNEGQSPS